MGFVTLLIAHITFNLPYIILSVLPKLQQMDRHLYEAAMDLGCTPVQAFFKVILPEIMPGVVSGALMAFTSRWTTSLSAILYTEPSMLRCRRNI
jgi:spermidine/putrescine transport system permease protein